MDAGMARIELLTIYVGCAARQVLQSYQQPQAIFMLGQTDACSQNLGRVRSPSTPFSAYHEPKRATLFGGQQTDIAFLLRVSIY